MGEYHGYNARNSRTYQSWNYMRVRCKSTKPDRFPHYKGKKIKVCNRWDSFLNFLEDMGERPEGTTLDRLDNSKGYSKENCRWATPIEQGNNKDNNIFIEYLGERLTLAQWSRKLGISQTMLYQRYYKKVPVEEMMTRPSKRKKTAL